jgi:hypothetical protein
MSYRRWSCQFCGSNGLGAWLSWFLTGSRKSHPCGHDAVFVFHLTWPPALAAVVVVLAIIGGFQVFA